MKHLPEGRHISIENLPLSVEIAMRSASAYANLLSEVTDHQMNFETISDANCEVILDLLSWLKMELS